MCCALAPCARYCMNTANHDFHLEFMNIQLWAALSTELNWDTVHGSTICWNKLDYWRTIFWKMLNVWGKSWQTLQSIPLFPSWGNLSNTGFSNKIWQIWSLPHYVSQSAFLVFLFLKCWSCIAFSLLFWEKRTLCQQAPYFWLFLNLCKSSHFLL